MSIVRLYFGRPAFVGDVCVSVHDGYYLYKRTMLRRRIATTPPGSAKKLYAAVDAYKAFERSEAEWYAAVGLTPPNPAIVDARRCKAGHVLEPWRPTYKCLACRRLYQRKYREGKRTRTKPLSTTKDAVEMRAKRARIRALRRKGEA